MSRLQMLWPPNSVEKFQLPVKATEINKKVQLRDSHFSVSKTYTIRDST